MNDELANPFRKRGAADERRPSRPPGGTPRELVRLYVMALVFFMAVGTMIYMWKTAAAPKKPPSSGVGLIVRPDGTRSGPDGQAPSEPPLPPVKKDVPLQEIPKDGLIDFRKLAEPFHDGLDKPVKETPEFVAILRTMLTAVTPEMLLSRVNPQLNAEKAYQDTPKHRGDVIRTYGRLVKIYTEPLDTTIPENLTHVRLGIMMEYPTNRTVWFYMPETPKDPQTGEPIKFKTYSKKGEEFFEDWVEVEGVVLRRYDYPSLYSDEKDQTAWARALLLFSKGVRITTKPQMTSTKAGFVSAVVVITVVVVAIVLTAGIMSRRYGGGDGSLRMALVAAKREKAKEKGESFFPPADPAKQPLGPEVKADLPATADAAPKDVPPAAP